MASEPTSRLKRWAKVLGHFVLVAVVGGSEYPLGQYDPKPAEPEEDGEEGW
jgi:hypothetical protein